MAYKESLLQWIWQELQFNCSDLHTTCGKKIEIRDNGTLNQGEGPDFLGAHLFIDGLDWHGSVEIHRTAKEWVYHGHDRDENFNNVVLHVVGKKKGMTDVKTSAGSKPFALCLSPYLQRGLNELLQNSKGSPIPCAGNVEFIHQRAFEQQIEAAHKEYFDFKVNDIIELYPAGVPVITAWKQAFIHQVYRTLGISANREQMKELGRRVAAADISAYDLEEWQKAVEGKAFDPEDTVDAIHWATTGIRPSGRPEVRVKQAAAFQYASAALSPHDYLQGPDAAWKKIQQTIPENSRPGKLMNRLIFYTSFIPALYLLGKLLHDKTLMNECYSYWMEQPSFVPESMQVPFTKAGFEVNGKIKKLGLAHQYKRYCSMKNCLDCKVFKNAIRA